MKKIILIAWLLGTLLMPLSAQLSNQMIQSLKKGDIDGFARFFGEEITLIIGKENVELKKEEAKSKLNEFFIQNKVLDFELKHQGDRDNSAYIIGALKTSNGEFRLNCFFKKINEDLFIHRIRIEK
ncbi:MAG: DUF4783 domain-containing protein [Bacteroidales bacterium]|mgnify:CR=1 FL=1|nr:DUF4783 domain-containing protein [Bacteroidales bacterium]